LSFLYYLLYFNIKIINKHFIWGLGIGDWGLGIGDWGVGPIPKTPKPKPQTPKKKK
jgi:hypothetical protein